MPALPVDRVHHGYWVDHSHINAQGATITVRSNAANIIVSVLSVLVTLAGIWWWELVSLALFLITSNTQSARASMVQQRQILLRNLISPASFLAQSFITLSANKRGPRGSAAPLIVPMSIAALSTMGFIVAGIFTSQVVSTNGIQVLADSDRCGLPFLPNGSETPGQLSYGTFNDIAIAEAWDYSQTCYASDISQSACNVYSQPTIGNLISTDTVAPFPQAYLKSSKSVAIDSGLIDSTQLGINNEEADGVSARLVVTCSVLDGDRYIRTVNASALVNTPDGPPASSMVGEAYAWNFGISSTNFSAINNLTTIRTSNSVQYSSGYSFDQYSFYIGDTTTDLSRPVGNFIPLPELQAVDGDTLLMQVAANSMSYLHPVDDPLFAAHRGENTSVGYGYPDGVVEVYGADSLSGWLGCKQQYQLCNADGTCTKLDGYNNVLLEALSLSQTPIQRATTVRMFFVMGTFTELAGLGSPPLNANRFVTSGISQGLPSDQWETEIRTWFNFTLAALQTKITYYNIGYDIAVPSLGNQTIQDVDSPGFCGLQKLRAPIGFSNVSVLGLGIIVGISCLLFLLNSFLIPLAHVIDRRGISTLAKFRSWDQAGTLQLHRKLYEVLGYDNWDLRVRTVPVYMNAEDLPPLPDHFCQRWRSSSAVTPFTNSTDYIPVNHSKLYEQVP